MTTTVRLISASDYSIVGAKSLEDLIVYVARVSNPASQEAQVGGQRLINYLIKNRHWSPFETANVTLEIKTTRDISHQILRHRSFVFQEFSQRYGLVQSFHPGKIGRLQDDKNRQNSIPLPSTEEFAALNAEWILRQNRVVEVAREEYEWAISKGFAKECARVVLPEGLTLSTIYMTGNVRSWYHYCEVRALAKSGSQLEHIDVAMKCHQVLAVLMPNIFPRIETENTK
jgi:thymidylate synthase (FAD)